MSLTPTQRVAATGMRAVAGMLCRRLRLRVEGAEHVPASGPALLAARHYHNFWDGCALLVASGRNVHLVVALDWAANVRQLALMQRLTHLAAWPVLLREERVMRRGEEERPSPFGPEDVRRYRLRCVRQCIGLLKEGRLLAMFPEGYPNIDPHFTLKQSAEQFLPFRCGFARLAVAAARHLGRPIPVVPVGLHYHERPPRRLSIRFGAALQVDAATDPAATVVQVESLVQRLSQPAG